MIVIINKYSNPNPNSDNKMSEDSSHDFLVSKQTDIQ